MPYLLLDHSGIPVDYEVCSVGIVKLKQVPEEMVVAVGQERDDGRII